MVVRIEPVLDAADGSISEEGPEPVEWEFPGRASEVGRVKTIRYSNAGLDLIDVHNAKQVVGIVPIVANVHQHVLLELALNIQAPLLSVGRIPRERYERRAARTAEGGRVSRNVKISA